MVIIIIDLRNLKMLTDLIGRHLVTNDNSGPTVFLVGTATDQINFCEEAKTVLGVGDCGLAGETISVSAPYDPSLAKLPEQNERLFADLNVDEANPFTLTLTDDLGIYGRWEVTYTSSIGPTATQIIEI